DALLAPDLTFAKLAFSLQACQLCARAGATRRTVISFAGTEHKVPAVHTSHFGRSEELDVIDLLSSGAGDPLPDERFSDAPCKVSQGVDVVEIDLQTMILNKEEPVTSPRDITRNGTIAGDIDSHFGRQTVARDVDYADLSRVMKEGLDLADRCFDQMAARS